MKSHKDDPPTLPKKTLELDSLDPLSSLKQPPRSTDPPSSYISFVIILSRNAQCLSSLYLSVHMRPPSHSFTTIAAPMKKKLSPLSIFLLPPLTPSFSMQQIHIRTDNGTRNPHSETVRQTVTPLAFFVFEEIVNDN